MPNNPQHKGSSLPQLPSQVASSQHPQTEPVASDAAGTGVCPSCGADLIWIKLRRMANLWSGFWEFGDDSADEMAFMEDLQEVMRLVKEGGCADKLYVEALAE